MSSSLGSVFALACAIVLADAKNIILNKNGCPISPNYEKLLPHENCHQFYQCVNGRLVPQTCPEGLLYNEKILTCDWPQNVICKDTLYSATKTQYLENSYHKTISNSYPNDASRVCATANSDNVLVAHENCNQFYKCFMGRPVALKCPANLLFNTPISVCDWANNVECGDRLIPSDNDNEDQENGSGDSNQNEDGEEHNNDINGDPSEAPAICLKEGSDGVLIAHEICNKFYKCSWGLPVTLNCPLGLLYNFKTEQCDWPNNVFCGERLILEDDSSEGSGNEHDDSANCDPSKAPAICAEKDSDGVLVAHENCNQFYKCSRGHPVALYCPSGLLYNSKGKMCDWAENVKCEDRIIPGEKDGPGNYDPSQAPTICASKNSDGILVAHEKCNHFYKCSNGKPVSLTCPSELFFNAKRNKCDWLDNVDCGQRVIPGENDLTFNIKDSFKKYSDHSYPTQASVICAKEESDNVLVAHEKCNHFYGCAHGKPVAFKCAAKLLYNLDKLECDWPENVDCGNRIIPEEKDDEEKDDNEKEDDHKEHEGHSDPSKAPYICAKEESDGILIAHEKCNYFYICVHGQPMAMSCPENLMYNPEKGECDWSSNVKCNKRIVS